MIIKMIVSESQKEKINHIVNMEHNKMFDVDGMILFETVRL